MLKRTKSKQYQTQPSGYRSSSGNSNIKLPIRSFSRAAGRCCTFKCVATSTSKTIGPRRQGMLLAEPMYKISQTDLTGDTETDIISSDSWRTNMSPDSPTATRSLSIYSTVISHTSGCSRNVKNRTVGELHFATWQWHDATHVVSWSLDTPADVSRQRWKLPVRPQSRSSACFMNTSRLCLSQLMRRPTTVTVEEPISPPCPHVSMVTPGSQHLSTIG